MSICFIYFSFLLYNLFYIVISLITGNAVTRHLNPLAGHCNEKIVKQIIMRVIGWWPLLMVRS